MTNEDPLGAHSIEFLAIVSVQNFLLQDVHQAFQTVSVEINVFAVGVSLSFDLLNGARENFAGYDE